MFKKFLSNTLNIMLCLITILLVSGCREDKVENELSSYEYYLDSLNFDIVHSIPAAVKYYQVRIRTLPIEKRDSAFFVFNQFYYKVKFKLNDSLMYDLDLLNKLSDKAFNKDSIATGFKKIIKENGFKLFQSEGYFYVEESPDFLYSRFGKYVSPSISEYLKFRRNELKEGFAEDAVLMIPMLKVAQRIINWEKYLIKFPNSFYAEQVNSYLGMYVNALLGGLDNSPIFDENKKLIPEIKKLTNIL